ncbi:MAG: hypothetical protein R3E08_00170 [Thiotrichaceae bacterium]
MKEINYQAGKWELTVELPDTPTLELLKRYLKEAGFNAVTASSTMIDAKIRAKVRIES